MKILKQGYERVAEASEGKNLVGVVVSGLLGTALGITITYTTGVASNRTEIVRLATQVQNLTNIIQSQMDDRYRASDASRDLFRINEKITELIAHDKEIDVEMRAHLGDHRRLQGSK
jgi:hypothetical protein